jgi:hypothetical protein
MIHKNPTTLISIIPYQVILGQDRVGKIFKIHPATINSIILAQDAGGYHRITIRKHTHSATTISGRILVKDAGGDHRITITQTHTFPPPYNALFPLRVVLMITGLL